MARGPLPNPQSRRRNAPTIPTSPLPAEGRQESAPECPYELERAGRAWWAWVWATPQAVKFDGGALYALARRAQLEDLRVTLEAVEEFDVAEFMAADPVEAAARLKWMLRTLKAAAGGLVGVMREMRELDNRFGLNAKAMADLRWSIEDVPPAGQIEPGSAGQVRPLRAV